MGCGLNLEYRNRSHNSEIFLLSLTLTGRTFGINFTNFRACTKSVLWCDRTTGVGRSCRNFFLKKVMVLAPLIDTHAHLTHPDFHDDLREVRDRAETVGVRSVLVVSETLSDAERVLSLTSVHHPWMQAAIGLHPQYISTLCDESVMNTELQTLSELAHRFQNTLAAIGEAGLDFSPNVLATSVQDHNDSNGDHNDDHDHDHDGNGGNGNDHDVSHKQKIRNRQIAALEFQLRLAADLGLPVTLHSRNAGHYVLETVGRVVNGYGKRLSVCMHAYDGRFAYVQRAFQTLSMVDLYFSIAPCVVRQTQFQTLVKRLPLNRILLESDAPSLSNVKGTRSEPAQLANTLSFIANLKNVNEESLRNSLYQNTMRVFPRLRPLFHSGC